jgi:predicted TIM-barrel fold metal-dependent hydrolase
VNAFELKPEVRRKFMRDNAIRVYGLEGLSSAHH